VVVVVAGVCDDDVVVTVDDVFDVDVRVDVAVVVDAVFDVDVRVAVEVVAVELVAVELG